LTPRLFVTLAALPLALAVPACGGDGDDGKADDDTVDPDANADGDCMTDLEEADMGTDPSSVDTDADGIDDCAEMDLGTDATLEDSDGDGTSDPEEVACVSDPTDGTETCYACGWPHNDPGDIVSEGNDEGDFIDNVVLEDTCEEEVDLWDFYGEYHILLGTATW